VATPQIRIEAAIPTSSGGRVRVGGRDVVIHDPHEVEAVSADLITEVREFDGICALSFATVVSKPNGNGSGTVEGAVCARLRFSMAGALNLRNTLDNILKASMPAKRRTN
jgi:hypothetical protein